MNIFSTQLTNQSFSTPTTPTHFPMDLDNCTSFDGSITAHGLFVCGSQKFIIPSSPPEMICFFSLH